MDAFFFPTTDNLQLFGVARGPKNAVRAWVLCPPFAEEEKTSRRIFTLIAQMLEARGEASLIFSFRGTGDSEGNFVNADLTAWRHDLQAATHQLATRAPGAKIAFLGVRLGASLALQEARSLGASQLILIEPLLSGRSFLMQQNAKKQIRAQLTDDKASALQTSTPADDLDGWQLGSPMKSELSALDLRRETLGFTAKISVLQVGPREEITPPLRDFVQSLRANSPDVESHAVVMPSFWNLIDAPSPHALLTRLNDDFQSANRLDEPFNEPFESRPASAHE